MKRRRMSSSWPRRTEGYFQRHKVSSRSKAEAARLYGSPLPSGHRETVGRHEGGCETVDPQVRVTLLPKTLPRRKERSVILLDETKVKRNGKIACASTHLTRREIVSAKSYTSRELVNH